MILALLAAASLAAAAPEPAPLGLLKDGLTRIVAKIEAAAADPNQPLSVRDLPNAALGELALGGDPKKAESLLRLMFAQQDMDAKSPGYGTVPWEIRGKTVTDPNAIEFSMQAVGPILIRYGERLSPAFLQEAPPHLTAAVAALERHKVPILYTNIFLMKSANLILLGRVLKDERVAAEGEAMLDAWLEQSKHLGITEYDSPTYYKVDANDLNYGYLYAEKTETKEKFKAALDILWTDIGSNYFPGRGSLSGPHSRDYDFLTGHSGLDVFFIAYGWAPMPKTSKGLDIESVGLLQNELDQGYRPGPEIIALTKKPERWNARLWGDQPGQDRTNYITPDFAIGGASHDYCPYDKSISIQLASKKPLTDISVVVDDSDEPYGKTQVENPDGHSKPHHLSSRPVTLQNKGLLLATFIAAPDKKHPSPFLATNVLLPLAAEEISIDGERVEPGSLGEWFLTEKSVVAVREGDALALVRVFLAQACKGERARLSLKIDAAGLKYKTARLVIAHHDPADGNAPESCRAGSVILFSAVHAGDGPARAAALQAMSRSAVTVGSKDGVYEVTARSGGSVLELTRDTRAKTIPRRAADGVPVVFGPSRD